MFNDVIRYIQLYTSSDGPPRNSTTEASTVMDKFTLVFIVTLLVIFVILRWFIAPIPESVPNEFNIPDPAHQTAPATEGQRTYSRRRVTESMIDVVQAIAPQLTASQIKYSLEKTGSVEATVDEYMENGTLPFPPGEAPPSQNGQMAEPSSHDGREAKTHTESASLLEKYNVDDSSPLEEDVTGKWGKDESERVDILQKRKAEMILRARSRLEKTLTEAN